MIVLPSNNSMVHKLSLEFPGRLGLLMSPDGLRSPKGLPYALDNGKFGAWKKSGFSLEKYEQDEHWDAMAFLDSLVWARRYGDPLFVVVPDVPGNAEETRAAWEHWAPRIKECGFQLAMAVQDGMTPADVPAGVTCFIGGTTEWKWANVERFAAACDVHVARVNGYRGLWQCHEAGVKSVDGTGWFRGDQKQLRGLIRYLRESGGGVTKRPCRQGRLFA